MSYTDPSPDAVQPQEGQGEHGTEGSAAPYADDLNRIPEEMRAQVEPVFRDWDSKVTRRFQEASEQLKAWEPYEQVGVSKLSPEEVQWALQFREAAAQNPQAIKEWYSTYAQENGIADQQPQPQPPADEFAFQDPAQQLEQLLSQRLSPFEQQLQQVAQRLEAQDMQAREQQVNHALDARMGELEQQHGDAFNRAIVEAAAWKYAEPGADPRKVVDQAWADVQAFANQVERRTLQGKADAPPPPEGGGGVPNAGVEQPSFASGELGRQAAAQIRAALQNS